MNQFIKEIQEQPEMLEHTLGYYRSREGKERLKMLSVPCGQPVTMTK